MTKWLRNPPSGNSLATLLIKRRLWYRCFPVNFAKFLITNFLQNTLGGCFCRLIQTRLLIKNRTDKINMTCTAETWYATSSFILMQSPGIHFFKKQPPEVFCVIVFLEISQNSQEKTCVRASFLIKLQA